MSYDLAIWEGERPASDAEAAEVFGQLVDRYLEQRVEEPTSPAIRSFAEALFERWPDITVEGSDDSPWSIGPISYENIGTFFYVPMRFDRARAATEVAADLAAKHGLVCFDPQTGKLRPPTGVA